MAAYACLAACLLAALSAALLGPVAAQVFLSSRSQRARGQRQRDRRRLGERALAACEALGHRPRVIQLCNATPVKPAVEAAARIASERGLVLSRYGAAVAACGILAALCLAGAFLSWSALGALVGIVVFAVGAASLAGAGQRKRSRQLVAQMPEALRTLASALAAGRSLPQAVKSVGSFLSDPLSSEFLRASFEIESGEPVEKAVGALCERIDVPGAELLGTALQVSQRTGSSLSELLARTSRMVQGQSALHRELEVKTSQARLSARVVAAVPVVLACILVLISPDYRAGLATGAGRACLCISALLDAVALIAVRSMMKRSLR